VGRLIVSIKPFADDEGDTYEADFIDVSRDVVLNGVGKLKQYLDNNEFDIGIFRHANFSLKLVNRNGKYSDVDGINTIFKSTRSNSIVRLEWDANPVLFSLGFHPYGEFGYSERQLVGDFFLNDDSLRGRANDETVRFDCLGKSVLFDQETVPFAAIAVNDLLSVVVFKCLNQASILRHLTVDAANITLDIDHAMDDKTLGDLENKTVTEAFKKLLKYANSVLRIDGSTVIVSPRTVGTTLAFTFRGAGSLNGKENISDIFDQTSGVGRVKNLVEVKDTGVAARNEDSITKYRVRKTVIEFLPVSTEANRQAAADAIVAEFGDPKQEMKILVPMDHDRLGITVLDLVKVDYPLRVIALEGSDLPEYGSAQYDVDFYAHEIQDIVISDALDFKVLSIVKDFNKEVCIFEIREVS